ncbi:hypothetical protein ACH4SP_24635 [Streptomyces sp. NPDC021093]|uniref:hypothetical protein n=1 Tax=Streptomyces sp. NPDC021093 TaxID=3365112 RepID=UPI003793C618
MAWGLIIETTLGTGQRKHQEAFVLAQLDGSREEAMAELERRARAHSPEHPRNPQRRRLLRVADGFLLVIDGSWQSYNTRFTLAEVLEDSAAPVAPEPEPEPVREPEPVPVQEPEPVDTTARYDDGVPVKPAWLGRTDLS